MKTILLTSIFALISIFTFAQNKPQFIVEQSAKGYDVILTLQSFSNLSSVKIEGVMQKNNLKEELSLDLNIMDIRYGKPFTSFGNDNVKAMFTVVITDGNGLVTRYPAIDLSLTKVG